MSLPVITSPYADEWLGFWLHRIAVEYGTNVAHLLDDPNAYAYPTQSITWGRTVSYDREQLNTISQLVRLTPGELEEMQSTITRRAYRAQVGCCPTCLLEDIQSEREMYWRRSWMDPYNGWCEAHSRQLMPIDAAEIRNLRTANKTDNFFQSIARSSYRALKSTVTLNQHDAQSVATLISRLRQFRKRKPSFNRERLRLLVDWVTLDAMTMSSDNGSTALPFNLPRKCDIELAPYDVLVGHLARVISASQRACLFRFAASVLTPSTPNCALRNAYWERLSDSRRLEIALTLREANASGARIKWPTAQNYKRHMVHSSILPCFVVKQTA